MSIDFYSQSFKTQPVIKEVVFISDAVYACGNVRYTDRAWCSSWRQVSAVEVEVEVEGVENRGHVRVNVQPNHILPTSSMYTSHAAPGHRYLSRQINQARPSLINQLTTGVSHTEALIWYIWLTGSFVDLLTRTQSFRTLGLAQTFKIWSFLIRDTAYDNHVHSRKLNFMLLLSMKS